MCPVHDDKPELGRLSLAARAHVWRLPHFEPPSRRADRQQGASITPRFAGRYQAVVTTGCVSRVATKTRRQATRNSWEIDMPRHGRGEGPAAAAVVRTVRVPKRKDSQQPFRRAALLSEDCTVRSPAHIRGQNGFCGEPPSLAGHAAVQCTPPSNQCALRLLDSPFMHCDDRPPSLDLCPLKGARELRAFALLRA